eukprot:7617776-Ditylum_brightwellii.AAC.1
MSALDHLHVFKYHDLGTKFTKEDGWQYTPMHMIFGIKHDLRHKACFVVGGHVIDSSNHTTYSSTVRNLSIKLMLLIAMSNNLGMMDGDIDNDFCNAPCSEKVWSMAGNEFGQRKGCVVMLNRALYGLKTASALFHKFFGDFLQELDFEPSKVDQDLWLRKQYTYECYDYIATHVDSIIIVTKNSTKYMDII